MAQHAADSLTSANNFVCCWITGHVAQDSLCNRLALKPESDKGLARHKRERLLQADICIALSLCMEA